MKKTIFSAKHIPANLFVAMLYMFVILFLVSCKKDSSAFIVKLDHADVHIEDPKMQPPSGENTLLWNNRGHVPIMAPDGHHITLGEFNKPTGYAEIDCKRQGTSVKVHVKGLIPNGVYTIWVLTFKSPGFEPTFANLIGNGALGAADGSMNKFTASSHGTATLSATMPAGPLSLFGSVTDCLFSEYEVHMVAAYHLDFVTHGGMPGPPNTWVAQFVFQFHQ
ncbi:MAG: hypothetical protein ABIO76_01290 [Ginsengibacter sp.]